MIQSIRHKGLRRLFEDDDESGVNPEHVGKLKNILATLNAAPTIEHLNLPGLRLHQLKGEMKGFWAVMTCPPKTKPVIIWKAPK